MGLALFILSDLWFSQFLRFSLREVASRGCCITASHGLKIRAMAVRRKLNALDEISCNDRRNGERFTRRRMESRVFLSSYRYRHFISLPCRPKPRKPLASYVHRLTILQCRQCREIFAEIDNSQAIYVSKYESSMKQRAFDEKFSKKIPLAERSRKNCWLCWIEQAKKGFICLLLSSFLFRAIADVIVSGMVIGIFFLYFLYIIEEDVNEKTNVA